MATYIGEDRRAQRTDAAVGGADHDYSLSSINGVDITTSAKHACVGGILTVRGCGGTGFTKYHKIIPFTITVNSSGTEAVVTHTALLDYDSSSGTNPLTVTLSISTTNLRVTFSQSGGAVCAIETRIEFGGYRET
jgi:hypothetical protein